MSRVLYDKKREQIDIFSYEINSGGEYDIKENGIVIIEFVNKKLNKVTFPMKGFYTRNGWRILCAIENEISEIEALFKQEFI